MRTTCENCNKLATSLIELNAILLCPRCFDEEIKRLATAVIEP